MELPLSPRAFRLVDGASKLVGLVAMAAALSGAAAPHSLAVGILGVCVGVATVFVSPAGEAGEDAPAAADPTEAPGDERTEDQRTADERAADEQTDDEQTGDSHEWRPVTGLAKRLWHSRLARLGGALWLVAFVVAGAGVVFEQVGSFVLAVKLFALSGPVGLLGVLALVVAGGWEAVTALRA